MSTKIFGFVGTECYDIIYYTAKVASSLGFKCLMVDLAKNGGLTYLYHGDCVAGDIVSVNNVDLVKASVDSKVFNDYDYVFLSFETNASQLQLCHELYFVTSFQKNQIALLKNLSVPNVPRYLVIRDRGACSMNYKYILDELRNLDVSEEDIYSLEDTDDDIAAKIYLQYSMNAKLGRLSSSVKALVEHLLDVDTDKKSLNAAWSALKKG